MTDELVIQPSKLSAFVQYIKLARIFARASKTGHPSNLPPSYSVVGMHDWESSIGKLALTTMLFFGIESSSLVAELDSTLTGWQNELPEDRESPLCALRIIISAHGAFLVIWKASDPNDTHFEQTACLQLMYHQVQMLIHQPFIPLLSGSPTPNSPSLTICKHAARSVSRILDARLKRGHEISAANLAICFNTSLMTLITIWDVKKRGLDVNTSGQIADVETCIRTLQAAERR